MSYFAQNLRFLRKEKGFSQEKLATELGLNRGNIASYEKGTAEPNMRNLYQIVKYFNIDLGDMIERDLSLGISRSMKRGESVGVRSKFLRELRINHARLEKYKKQSDSMNRILEGFKQFHQYKIESSSELSDDVKQMSDEYMRLLEIMNALLVTNDELVEILSGESEDELELQEEDQKAIN